MADSARATITQFRTVVAETLTMEHRGTSRLGVGLKAIVILGALMINARVYLMLLPHSPALASLLIIATGASLAQLFLHLDRRWEALRTEGRPVEQPPSY